VKRTSLHVVDWLYSLSFLLYLFGSSLAHIEHGSELSLWLMTFAVILTLASTLLPLAGIRWLRLERQGNRWGLGIAMLLQVLSWMAFFWAMSLRLGRNLPPFHTWITVTTLLWAAWLLIFIYSRHAHSS
jgi:Na+/proline symporter